MQSEKHPVMFNRSLIANLYQCYAPTLLMYICRHVPTREDAEDVLLEVFQSAVESETLAGLDAGKQRSWLWKVASNKAADHYRRTRSRPVFSAKLEEVEDTLYDDDFSTPEAIALRDETYAELRAHVSSLSEIQQEVLRLRFAHGLRSSEIAQRLNKSNIAVRVILSRSLNLLRDIYRQRKEDTLDGQK